MSRLDRQSFLGANSESFLKAATVGVVGLGGGGSHIVQQLSHIGVGGLVLVDPDRIEDTNTNRLVGGTLADVQVSQLKIKIAARVVRGLVPDCRLSCIDREWQTALDELRECDVIFGAVDSFLGREELERFCRAHLIPYIDIGMDVTKVAPGEHLISGQVVLSLPDGPCLRCFGIITDDRLKAEANRYGEAGGRPQVVWPNGVLASTAVGLGIQLLTPWFVNRGGAVYLEYDGNLGTLRQSTRLQFLPPTCKHHLPAARGDALFDVREIPREAAPSRVVAQIAAPPLQSSDVSSVGAGFWRRLINSFLARIGWHK